MTTPPGWYDDGHGALRWWDGGGWTEHVQPGASPRAPQPAKPASKLWIVWVVIAVVVAGIVLAAIVAIPQIVRLASGIGAALPSSGSEGAAVAAVQLYDDAWQQVECAKYEESTTQAYRDDFGFAACADFEAEAESFASGTDQYVLVITGVTREGDSIVVETSETYVVTADETGQALDEPEPASDVLHYTVVDDGGTWRIDQVVGE